MGEKSKNYLIVIIIARSTILVFSYMHFITTRIQDNCNKYFPYYINSAMLGLTQFKFVSNDLNIYLQHYYRL